MGFVKQEPSQREAFLIYPWGGIYKAQADRFQGFKKDADADVMDLIDRCLAQMPAASGYERRILMRGAFDPVDAPAGNTGCIDVDVGDVTFELRGYLKYAANVDKNLFEILNNVPRVKVISGLWDGNRDNQTAAAQVRGFNAVYTVKPEYIYGAHDIEIDGARFVKWPHRGIHIDALASGGTNTIRLHNFCAEAGKTGFAVGSKPYALCLRGVADSYVGGGLSIVASSWTEVYLEQVVDVWFEKIYSAGTANNGDELTDWYIKRSRRCWYIGNLMDWTLAHGMRFVDDDGGSKCEGNTLMGNQIVAHDSLPDNTYSGIRLEGHSSWNSISGGFIGQKHPEIADHSYKYAVEEVAGMLGDYNTVSNIPCCHMQTALFNKVGINSDFSHFTGDIA